MDNLGLIDLSRCAKNDFWYTPEVVLSAVRQVLGDDYHDPCPINPIVDGLTSKWGNNCFINPPYSGELCKAFINKAVEEYDGGLYIWLLNFNNAEYTRALRRMVTSTCIPYRRIQFLPGHVGLNAGSPMYDNIIYLWGDPTGFDNAFDRIGDVYERSL